MNLDLIAVERKTGQEPFILNHEFMPFNLLSFWQWSCSGLIGNALRGLLAEYIVATAVGCSGGTRTEWDAFDIHMDEGIKVEVKSAAYIQSWAQKQYSNIQFNVRPTSSWEEASAKFNSEKIRQSDVYVFCLLAHKDQSTINPLDLGQWKFYVVSTKTLNEKLGIQKSLSLSKLLSLKPVELDYSELKCGILNLMK